MKTVVRAPRVRRRVRVVARPARRVHKAVVAVANIALSKVVKRRVRRRVVAVRKVAAIHLVRSVTTVGAAKNRTAIAKVVTCGISPARRRVKVDSAVVLDRADFRSNKVSASLLESQ